MFEHGVWFERGGEIVGPFKINANVLCDTRRG